MFLALYLIEILHQTTTPFPKLIRLLCCILSKFYIKPQLTHDSLRLERSCILSKFYIKPQQRSLQHNSFCVVSYRNSTSNHNFCSYALCCWPVVSYRNSTSNHNPSFWLRYYSTLYLIEILHQTTTTCTQSEESGKLYLIEILHQTTTADGSVIPVPCCILSKFYIKPQRAFLRRFRRIGCILSKFYIKPQPRLYVLLDEVSCILSKFYIKPQRMVVEGYS